MYQALQIVHSYWAYVVVFTITLATINAWIGFFGKKEYRPKDFRIALFGLITTHLQLLVGIIVFLISPKILWFNQEVQAKIIMKDPLLRLYNVEHPITMLLMIVFVTIGYSKHKKKLTSLSKFKMLLIFYTLAWLLMLSRIPWKTWL